MGKSSMYGYEMILYLILTICPCIVLKTRFLMKKQGKYLVLSNFTSNLKGQHGEIVHVHNNYQNLNWKPKILANLS